MSSDPTPAAPPGPPAGPVIEYVAANRGLVAAVLLALGLASGVAALYCLYKVAQPGADAAKPADAAKADDLDKPADKPEVKLASPRQREYGVGGLVGLMGTVVGLGVGAWLFARPPAFTDAARRSDARVAVLLAGGLYGLVLMALGLLLFYLYFESLTKWVDQRNTSEARWPLIALAVFLTGAGVAFLAAQPARAEERHNPFLRRLVYGSNLVLTTVLLALLLLVGNLFAALRLPAKLDTTETGAHSLALGESTLDYLRKLDKTVEIHAILENRLDDPATLDARRMLDAAREANPDRVKLRYLDPTLNRTEITRLRNDYPTANINSLGILLTLLGNDKQAAYIRYRELTKSDFDGGRSRQSFQGESLFVRELLALTEAKSQPTVYFTQGAGELTVTPPPAGGADAQLTAERPANDLRTALERTNCKVLPLKLGPAADPKVPDDADIVVVADPLSPLSEKTAAAIARFMTEPRPNGKKGKLVVLAGPHNAPAGGSGLSVTGLEGVLDGLRIRLRADAVYGDPDGPLGLPADTLAVQVYPGLGRDNNPIALAYPRQLFPVAGVRLVQAVTSDAPGPGPKAQPLLITAEDRYTWLESSVLPNPDRAWAEIAKSRSEDFLRQKNVGIGPRPVGAIASDESGPRAVVFGTGQFFSDETTRVAGGRPIQADLFATSVNWLRDRPAAANVATKTYGQYTPKQNVNRGMMIELPVALAPLAIIVLGLAVWVSRTS